MEWWNDGMVECWNVRLRLRKFRRLRGLVRIKKSKKNYQKSLVNVEIIKNDSAYHQGLIVKTRNSEHATTE